MSDQEGPDDPAEGIDVWVPDPLTGEPIIHLGPNDDATQEEALGDPWQWEESPNE
jgi:hypothetical protein